MAASSRQRYVVVGGGIAGVSCAEEVRFVIKNERYSWKKQGIRSEERHLNCDWGVVGLGRGHVTTTSSICQYLSYVFPVYVYSWRVCHLSRR